MKNLSKEKKERIILVLMVTAIVISGAWYGLISAQNAKLAKIATSIEDKQRDVDNANRLLNSTSELEAKLSASSNALHSIEADMARGDMYSWIIQKVNTFKVGYDVDIPHFSREVTGRVEVLPRFPYEAAKFDVKGTAFFHDLGRFIADFENEFPHMRIQNLAMQPDAASATSAVGGDAPKNAKTAEKVSFRMELVALINPRS